VTDFWRIKYSYDGSDSAWFDYLGSWKELMVMMAENLSGVRLMEIKHLGQRHREIMEQKP